MPLRRHLTETLAWTTGDNATNGWTPVPFARIGALSGEFIRRLLRATTSVLIASVTPLHPPSASEVDAGGHPDRARLVVFESDETARAFFDMVNSAPTGPIVIQSMDVREVAAHA